MFLRQRCLACFQSFLAQANLPASQPTWWWVELGVFKQGNMIAVLYTQRSLIGKYWFKHSCPDLLFHRDFLYFNQGIPKAFLGGSVTVCAPYLYIIFNDVHLCDHVQWKVHRNVCICTFGFHLKLSCACITVQALKSALNTRWMLNQINFDQSELGFGSHVLFNS